MVQVYAPTGINKRRKWSDQRIVISIDKNARTVQNPTKNGKQATVAIEDIMPALSEDSFPNLIQSAIDTVDDYIDYLSNSAKIIDAYVSENLKSRKPTQNYCS